MDETIAPEKVKLSKVFFSHFLFFTFSSSTFIRSFVGTFVCVSAMLYLSSLILQFLMAREFLSFRLRTRLKYANFVFNAVTVVVFK
jgi:hypothetical protein